jgi:hypothetical protein
MGTRVPGKAHKLQPKFYSHLFFLKQGRSDGFSIL